MVAVFCKCQRDFDGLDVSPRKKFKRIRSCQDIMVVKFTTVIKVLGWWDNGDVRIAYEALEHHQPELFNN